MKTLREQLNHLLRPESCAGEFTMYEAAKIALVAKQMDALLEECFTICATEPSGDAVAYILRKLAKEGYTFREAGHGNDTDR